MKVRILKQDVRIKGRVGDVVEADPAIGNPLSTTGVVEIVEHDKIVIDRFPPKIRDYRPKWQKQGKSKPKPKAAKPAEPKKGKPKDAD